MNFTAEMYDRIVRTLAHDPPVADDGASRQATAFAPGAIPPSPDDARVEPRVGAHGGATVLVGGKPHPVRVRDVSRNGFGLLMVAPVAPGEQFAVSLAAGGAMSGLSIVCSTAYCRPAGHGLYSVGARLVRFSPRA